MTHTTLALSIITAVFGGTLFAAEPTLQDWFRKCSPDGMKCHRESP